MDAWHTGEERWGGGRRRGGRTVVVMQNEIKNNIL